MTTGNQYDQRADLWSVGAILYMLVTCNHLYYGSREEIKLQTLNREPIYYHKHWDNYSENLLDLTVGLLKKDPNERITMDEALDHPWFYEA